MKSVFAAMRRVATAALGSLILLAGAPATATPPDGPVSAVFVHGGGWVSGTPSMGDPMIPFFAKRAVPFKAIDYPLVPLVAVSQSVDAVRQKLVRNRAKGPLIVLGHSAGAHLAATATFSPGGPPVRCLILLDGIGYDLVGLLASSPGIQLRLGLTPATAAALSPTALIQTSKSRPAVFLAAGNDARGTSAQATAFALALKAKGFDVTLQLFPLMAHSDFLRDFADPTTALALNVGAFLAAHPRCGNGSNAAHLKH